MTDNYYAEATIASATKPQVHNLRQLTDEVMKLRAQVGDLREEVAGLRANFKLHEAVLGQVGAYEAADMDMPREIHR